MNYETIADIYTANDKIRDRLLALIDSLDEEEAAVVPDGENWSAAMIVEHVSLVAGSMVRICTKLLEGSKAEDAVWDGSLDLAEFAGRAAAIADVKLVAPDIVQPKQGLSLSESRAALEQNRGDFHGLRPMFEKFDPNRHKFPHPFFGPLTALEWLALAGAHEARHLRQIRNFIEKHQLSRTPATGASASNP
ncbi:MAG: DinB family protein [Chloracidobacterium sp.]|nr:DinB family protein [Chloracidobacterium sp.]